MERTAEIINLLEGMSSEDIEKVGSSDQIVLVKIQSMKTVEGISIEEKRTDHFNSMEEAQIAKVEWENSDLSEPAEEAIEDTYSEEYISANSEEKEEVPVSETEKTESVEERERNRLKSNEVSD